MECTAYYPYAYFSGVCLRADVATWPSLGKRRNPEAPKLPRARAAGPSRAKAAREKEKLRKTEK